MRALAVIAVLFSHAVAFAQDGAEEILAPSQAPVLLRGWKLTGTFLDSRETVRGFLTPIIEENRLWRAQEQGEVVRYLSDLGYHARIKNTRVPAGGVTATIDLYPIRKVRYVVLDVQIGLVERIVDPVFSEELRRRMTLRVGASLARTKKERKAQLEAEEARLEDFLRNEGFFEVDVKVVERRKGPHASQIRVVVEPGPAYIIGTLKVTGNNAVPEREITELFRHRLLGALDRRFSRDQLQKDIEQVVSLYQARGYPGVRVRTDFDIRHSFRRDTRTVEFTIEVRERRKIDVVFEGIADESFVEALSQVMTLNQEGSYDDVELRASAEAIRSFYQREGKFEASVTFERVSFGVFERVLFTIDEGPKLQVNEVLFRGNTLLTDVELGSSIKTRKWQRFIIGESGGYLTDVQLFQDADRIASMYRERGYLDVSVTPRVARSRPLLGNTAALAAAIAANVPSPGLSVLFLIEEGKRTNVEAIRFAFVGRHTLSAEELRKSLPLRPKDPLVPGAAKKAQQRIKRYYFSRGYPRADVELKVVPGSQPNRRVLEFSVEENNQAHIQEIALRGNFKTRNWVLLDELEFRRGDLLTVERAERAQSNLRRSGLFSSVRIDYQGLDRPDQEDVNVLISVEELHDNVGVLSAGFGFATDTKLFGEVGYRLANVMGIGARLDLRGVLGQERKSIDGKLAFPRWVMRKAVGLPFLLELSSFYQVENTRRFGDLRSLGSSIAATKQGRFGFFQGWSLSLRYDFRRRNRNEELVRTPGASDDISQNKQLTVSSTIGPQLVIDKRRDADGRRNPLVPARGFLFDLRATFGEDYLVGSNRFVKVGTSAQHFLSLGDRFLVTNALRYDHGFPLGGAVVLPEVERFFGGGDTTVRGFEEDRLATEVIRQTAPPLGGTGSFRIRPAGGNIRFIHNLELQVKVWRWRFPVASAIFLDSGFVRNSLDDLRFHQLRHAIGLALFRMVLPFGSLSVEYGIPLDPKLGDNPQGRFHVNLGLLF